MPRYILDLATVRTYLQICQNVAENLSKRLLSMSQESPQGRPQLPAHVPPQANSPPMAPPMSDLAPLQRTDRPTPSPRPPSRQPHSLVPPPQLNVPTPQPTQPSPRTQPIQTTPIPAPAKAQKKPTIVAETAASVSTPPASASTPANPPTPGHAVSSPQTPKSPKTKAPPKPKPKRKQSIKGQPPAVPASSSFAAAAAPITDQPSPAAATPDSGPKRKREEDVASTSASGEQTPSKKQKTEWEGPESEQLSKKKQAVEDVKIDEDATKFLENTMEMLVMATSEGKQVLPAEISDTINEILNNLSDAVPGIGSLDDTGAARSSTPSVAANGCDGLEFFDFTLYNEDGSKAPTPDLVQTSSTNPSPASDADSSHGAPTMPDTAHIADAKAEDELDGSDPLRMGFWSEVGGGEAAYFNSDPWKWEGSMPILDQPWAINDR
ncbi:uncharacterized protein PHACADRAFT_251692 [Phanerochaete carnosa HHB-10118-sp]|uniref:Uncharacterized protein n=1 Tax=Phanerochaete carnosa (strain HHB-10118-sp) TaxID=650164 RepID=K5WEZ4_PHACS|nr:uncharacterized protein PHACADRAFT_251692 [Phanerochaete carnosa HHB-10118-sp]EKM57825.1 hypothetical protein PHACADRAFT_251692 [Phanerochaete carnosa HHB-10118-sp]